jgi:hypothetical protein
MTRLGRLVRDHEAHARISADWRAHATLGTVRFSNNDPEGALQALGLGELVPQASERGAVCSRHRRGGRRSTGQRDALIRAPRARCEPWPWLSRSGRASRGRPRRSARCTAYLETCPSQPDSSRSWARTVGPSSSSLVSAMLGLQSAGARPRREHLGDDRRAAEALGPGVVALAPGV